MTTPTSPAPSQGGSWTQTGPLTFNHVLTTDSVTAGQTFLYAFAAPDKVMLYAYRNGATATAGAAISSGDDGRTGIMAHWVSPGF
ncbi:hypothetical protein ACWEQ8_30815 [Streptomyces noursei]